MMSSIPRRLATLVAALSVVACHRSAKVSSPTPAPSSAGTGGATMAKGGLPAGVTDAMVAEGKTLFAAASCTRCHGQGGGGGQNGPNLTDTTWVQIDGSFGAIVKTIQTGVPLANVKGGYRFTMKPLGGGAFTDAQVRSIAAYVYSLSHQ